jgi:mono/diheme cytochrome c family protein
MRVHTKELGLAAVAMALATAAAGWRPVAMVRAQAVSGPAPDSVEFYNQRVQPIFATNCYRCHGGMNHRGGLHLDSKEGLMRGGHDGVVVVPGHPEKSLLVALIRHEGPATDPMPMPPKSKISDADISTVTEWIKAGAVMP